jgi:hypothetical protein
MTDISITAIPKSFMAELAAFLAILIFLGLLTFVGQPSLVFEPQNRCGLFTIGESAIGGCHTIPPQPENAGLKELGAEKP